MVRQSSQGSGVAPGDLVASAKWATFKVKRFGLEVLNLTRVRFSEGDDYEYGDDC